jgi:hypothetical protein
MFIMSERRLMSGVVVHLLLLRRTGWKELIGNLKDHGKDDLNSRLNSLQHGKNDAYQIACEFMKSSKLIIMKPSKPVTVNDHRF